MWTEKARFSGVCVPWMSLLRTSPIGWRAVSRRTTHSSWATLAEVSWRSLRSARVNSNDAPRGAKAPDTTRFRLSPRTLLIQC